MLSVEQVLGLAPDASAAKAGQSLGKANKWSRLGRADEVVWGEIQGSGSTPYQVRVDVSEPAFKCSCPSRKFPCKHALGLMLVLAENSGAVAVADQPAWVSEWLSSRAATAQRKATRAEAKAEGKGPDPEAQAKRAADRDARIRDGLDETRVWLRDLVRSGLAQAQAQPGAFWERAAARLVDAQAPGVARRVRELGEIAVSGEGWQSRLLAALGRLHLLVEGYARLDALPPELAADVRSAVGLVTPQEEVLSGPKLRDRWTVLGQCVEVDDKLTVQRTWLLGEASRRPALVLSYAVGKQPLDRSLVVGTLIEAELAFYRSGAPLRALVAARLGSPGRPTTLPAPWELGVARRDQAQAVAKNPWLEQWPMWVGPVMPRLHGEQWIVHAEGAGEALPLDPRFDDGWSLLAIAGGRPIRLFGEWTLDGLLPLGVACERRYLTVSRAETGPTLIEALGDAA